MLQNMIVAKWIKLATKCDTFTPKIRSFLDKNNFSELLQDHRKAMYNCIFKIPKILIINLVQQICFKVGICISYTLHSNLGKFDKDQSISLDIPVV